MTNQIIKNKLQIGHERKSGLTDFQGSATTMVGTYA